MFIQKIKTTNEIVGICTIFENFKGVDEEIYIIEELQEELIKGYDGKFYKKSESPEPSKEEKLAALKEDYEKTVSE